MVRVPPPTYSSSDIESPEIITVPKSTLIPPITELAPSEHGYLGELIATFGLWGADAGAGVLVRSDRVRIYRTPYEDWNGADYLVAKVIVSTVAPSASDVAPDGTLWCQV